jgi:hypothetical protein
MIDQGYHVVIDLGKVQFWRDHLTREQAQDAYEAAIGSSVDAAWLLRGGDPRHPREVLQHYVFTRLKAGGNGTNR